MLCRRLFTRPQLCACGIRVSVCCSWREQCWRRRNGAYLLSPKCGNDRTFSANCTTNKIMWFHNVETQLQLACGRVFDCLRALFFCTIATNVCVTCFHFSRSVCAPRTVRIDVLCVVFGELFRCVSNTLIPFRLNWIRFACVGPARHRRSHCAPLLSIFFVLFAFCFRSRCHTSAAVQCVVRYCLCFGIYLRKAPATK